MACAAAWRQAQQKTLGRIFRLSAATRLLNPKALLFFLVFHAALGAFSGTLLRRFPGGTRGPDNCVHRQR